MQVPKSCRHTGIGYAVDAESGQEFPTPGSLRIVWLGPQKIAFRGIVCFSTPKYRGQLN